MLSLKKFTSFPKNFKFVPLKNKIVPVRSYSTIDNNPVDPNTVVIGNINQDRKLGIIFDCTVCRGRCAKTFSYLSYTKGVVIITCPTCKNRHLIADNLGWFKDKSTNVETMAAEKGEAITRITHISQLENLIDADSVHGMDLLKHAMENPFEKPENRLPAKE